MATGKKIRKKSKRRSRITPQMFKNLQEQLRELDLGWVDTLEQQILADEEVSQEMKTDLNGRKIYNVFHNIVRNNAWNVLIYTQAKKLKLTLESKLKKATA